MVVNPVFKHSDIFGTIKENTVHFFNNAAEQMNQTIQNKSLMPCPFHRSGTMYNYSTAILDENSEQCRSDMLFCCCDKFGLNYVKLVTLKRNFLSPDMTLLLI